MSRDRSVARVLLRTERERVGERGSTSNKDKISGKCVNHIAGNFQGRKLSLIEEFCKEKLVGATNNVGHGCRISQEDFR